MTEGFGVTLDTRPVDRTGEMEVCPAETRGYELAVDVGTHMETRVVEITVSGTAQAGGPGTVTPGAPAYQSGTWVFTGGPIGGLGYDVHMDPRNPDVMYVTDAYAGAFKSTDGGATWETLGAANGFDSYDLYIGSLFIHPQDPDILLAAAGNDPYSFRVGRTLGGVYRTADGGQTWQPVSGNLSAVIPPPQDPGAASLAVYSLAVDPSNPEKVFAGFYGGSLAVSLDGGQTWSLSASGMIPEAMVTAIVVDPTNPQVVYAGTLNSGVYLSLDGGQTWSALNNGLLTRAVRGLALSSDSSVLYMTSDGGGVFRLGTP